MPRESLLLFEGWQWSRAEFVDIFVVSTRLVHQSADIDEETGAENTVYDFSKIKQVHEPSCYRTTTERDVSIQIEVCGACYAIPELCL